jgi:hypothetical protein
MLTDAGWLEAQADVQRRLVPAEVLLRKLGIRLAEGPADWLNARNRDRVARTEVNYQQRIK